MYTETLEGDGQEVGGLADLPSSRIAPAYRDLANDLGVEDFYEEARSTAAEAAAANEVRGRVASDFLESHRDNVRKKFDDIDAEFRERLDAAGRRASEGVQDSKAPTGIVMSGKLGQRKWVFDRLDDAHSVLLHIPHSSTVIPDRFADLFTLDPREVVEELLVMTDHHTDSLFEFDDSDRLVFPVSRLLVDPERFRDDAQEPMSSRGMGVVYTKTHHGRDLKSDRVRKALVEEYYDPHHAAMDAWASDRRRRHGRCLIIDCHSFPRTPLPCDLDQTTSRPDICIGTSAVHTTDTVARVACSAFEARGYTVEFNRPYQGTIVPPRCLEKDPFVQSIMIEVGRWLYMDEATGERLSTFETCQESVQTVMEAIAEVWRGATPPSKRRTSG